MTSKSKFLELTDHGFQQAGRAHEKVRIRTARATHKGRQVAVVQNADWVADYVDYVETSPTGRPLVPVGKAHDLARYVRACGDEVALESALV